MKLKILAALLATIFVAGCGGSDDNNSGTPASSTGASGTGTGTGGASANGTTSLSSSGTQYLTETAQVGQSQTQQSQAVAGKTTNPEVKALAQQVTNEVTVINQQITQISQTSNVTINNTVTSQQQTQINNLNALSGTELDRTYVSGVVDAWARLLASTLAQARQGTDVQIKQAASANILAIEQRLAAAKEVLAILQPTAFLTDAYEDGLLEIQLGQLALQKATNAQVKQFAQRMIDDHTTVNAQITALARVKGVTLPTALSAADSEIVTLISGFSGADFDKAYMDRNVLVHAEDVSKATLVSEQSTDTDIKALAAQSLPTLQAHLQLAQSIATSLQATQLYQLGQSLLNEMQIAQLVQTRSNNTQIKTAAQQIITANQAAFTQLVQLLQQRSQPIPLTLRPEQVTAVLELLRAQETDADTDVNQQLLSLLRQQVTQALQVTQSAQAGSDTGLSSFASAWTSALQTSSTTLEQLAAGGSTGASGSASSGNGASSSSTSSTTPTGSSTTTTGSGGSTGTGSTGTGSTGTGSTGTGTSTSGSPATPAATTATPPTTGQTSTSTATSTAG